MSSETTRLIDKCRPKLDNNNVLNSRKQTKIEFRNTRKMPPTIDSGWAWAVLGGSCLSNFILWGFTSSIGILYVPIQASVNTDLNSVSWIGTLLNGGMLVLGEYEMFNFKIIYQSSYSNLFGEPLRSNNYQSCMMSLLSQ